MRSTAFALDIGRYRGAAHAPLTTFVGFTIQVIEDGEVVVRGGEYRFELKTAG